MSKPFKFNRIPKGNTPVGGWKEGHIYFIHDTSTNTGEVKICLNPTGPILENYLHPTTTILDVSSSDNDIVSGKAIYDVIIENEEVTAAAINELNTNKESNANKVTSLSSISTDTQYPSAKCVYDNTVTLDSSQILTSVQQDNVLRKLNIADERINLTIDCNDPSAVIGVTVTVTYDNISNYYTYAGTTLSIIVPMFSEYTVSFSNIPTYYTPESFSFFAKRNVVRNVTVIYNAASYIDLSYRDVNGNDLSTRETANCYVVKEAGYYRIPLVYGNAIKNSITNDAAYTQIAPESGNTQPFYNYKNVQITSPYIEIDTGESAVSGTVLYSDTLGYNLSNIKVIAGTTCSYVQFEIESVPALGGNLLLGIKDSNNQVMWSWHIWAYPSTIGYKSHTNTTGYTYDWMDVDLGWIKAADGSIYGESPYYQWGRKDPMLRYNNKSTTPAIGSWSVTSCATSLAATIQNPNVFNTSGGNYNWWTDNGTVVNFFNYWDASTSTTGNADNTVVKTIYDPCPRGWHVPNGNCFTGCSTSNGGTWNQGWTWDERYFRASGCRHYTSGSVNYFTSNGNRWLSSSYSAYDAYRLYFDSSNVGPQDRYTRSFGFPVCPLRELN